MTLLVGVLCSNGAVIAADRQASHGAFGQLTVGQPATKIKVIGQDALFASSGAIGLSQQFSYIVESDHAQIKNRNYQSVVTLFQKKFREILEPAFKTASAARGLLGDAAQADAICGSLLASRYND